MTGAMVKLRIDGQQVAVLAGSSVAAAIAHVGGTTRTSCTGMRRAPLCGMGVCFECRATVNGIAQERTCLLPVAEAMEISTHG
ncbi:(2Fe-2S)-binding protein [Stenotrophomonas sp. SY1]|uniref:(2Fe-2S)-binding protein n=1 Tax=Stenotrophomonas sp. SY1 TaxID=477235 RepID=UPI001E313B30|nr:(2Fe-2S)-binding protein [Stenotrophomonas sp. SY1]MCD9085240.1 (2Fe-2S)-binding protein [Stenotrophomonas sp. SY1]